MNRVFQSLRRRVSSSEAGNSQSTADSSSSSGDKGGGSGSPNASHTSKSKSDSKGSKSSKSPSSASGSSVNQPPDGELSDGAAQEALSCDDTLSPSSQDAGQPLTFDLDRPGGAREPLHAKSSGSHQNADASNCDGNVSFPPLEFIRNEKFAFLQAFSADHEGGSRPSSDEEPGVGEVSGQAVAGERSARGGRAGSPGELNRVPNSSIPLPTGLVVSGHGISLQDDPFSALPLLQNLKSANDILPLVKRKLIACCITFNFTNNSYSALKEKKRETLLELVEYINNNDQIFQEEIIPDVLLMITSNIFRSFNQCHANLNTGNSHLDSGHSSGGSGGASTGGPSLGGASGGSASESKDDEQLLEPSWPHLLVIYEFFLRFVISPQFGTKVAKKYIDNTFILKLIDLFQSFDPRERDYLKTILHRIYGKIMPRRSCIRKAMKHIFLRVIIDGEPYNGIAELLEIFVSIVNGFTIPLKEEHKIFLETALIPLHKAKYISSFHQQLIYCLIQYIEKDTKLAVPIIEGVLKYWPVTNSSKQILFLNELEELLEITPTNYIEPILIPIFERLASCIQSPHFHVAERVLYLWNNDIIVNLINEYKYEIYPVLIKALSCNGKKLHWNPTVHGLSFVVNKVLSDTDPELFSQIIEQFNDDSTQIETQKKEREEYWKYIIELAESMD
ncbi:protein phosphatase 2A regulatory B subunit [Cryptosporidium canis]|uniref:Protein phosphatase 2A regulatory B subunit n=1 Tax=Cryptosporidium canis TaxID=195482 RepID=A0ABQ8P248_9CRYT|nr:protein phosphatase 2A regulatory B subunit [Cryptosporidium canis]